MVYMVLHSILFVTFLDSVFVLVKSWNFCSHRISVVKVNIALIAIQLKPETYIAVDIFVHQEDCNCCFLVQGNVVIISVMTSFYLQAKLNYKLSTSTCHCK